MNPIVYLAGPIAGCTYAGCTNWREDAHFKLATYRIASLDPMRAKGELQIQGKRIGTDFKSYEDMGPFFTSRGIMARDFSDVKRSDALLVNLLGTNVLSTGTVMELGWAYAMQKPVVVAIENEGNPHDRHPLVFEAIGALRFDDLEEAVHATAVLLGRG